jgi:hypothetical protein
VHTVREFISIDARLFIVLVSMRRQKASDDLKAAVVVTLYSVVGVKFKM